MVYKVIGGRKMEESEVAQLLADGKIGPLDGFRSAKTGKPYSAVLRYNPEEKRLSRLRRQRDATGRSRSTLPGWSQSAPPG